MGVKTDIGWTDHTFNPWWGCAHVSPGCVNCYAETFAKRTGHDVWGAKGERRLFGQKHWNEPVKWNSDAAKAGRQDLVFCASMADVFEEHPATDSERVLLWSLIEQTPNLTWQLLTKRPENVMRLIPSAWVDGFPRNVWIGTTTEDQQRLDERIAVLLPIPAVVRFLSCEPLLGPLTMRGDWRDYLHPTHPWNTGSEHDPRCDGNQRCWAYCPVPVQVQLGPRGVDWVIAGGESGARHRPMEAEWVRTIRDECEAAGVPFFFKQWGGRTPKAGGRELDGRTWDEFPPNARSPVDRQEDAP